MFYESSFIAAVCTLTLQVINASYLKKLCEWENFKETDSPVSAVKYRLDFLFFVEFNLCAYSASHGKNFFGKTREQTAKASASEILL